MFFWNLIIEKTYLPDDTRCIDYGLYQKDNCDMWSVWEKMYENNCRLNFGGTLF